MIDEAIYLLVIGVALLIVELLYFKLAKHFGIVDRPSARGSSTRVTLRGGGIIFYLGVVAYLLTGRSMYYIWFFLGLTAIAIVSFIDDLHSLKPKLRLLVHFLAMVFLFVQLGLFTVSSWLWLPVAFIVCAGVVNIFNFMDGINGITGGYALVGLGFLLYVDYAVQPFADAVFIKIMIVAVLIFCFFNFRTKAKCFAGDVGSVSIAFVLLFLVGKLVITTHDFSWFIVMIVYGVDGFLTIVHRIIMHEDLTKPHRNHAYQIMANELGMPHVSVSLIYMALQSVACAVYIVFPGYITLVAFTILYSIAYVLFMKKYFYLHRKNM